MTKKSKFPTKEDCEKCLDLGMCPCDLDVDLAGVPIVPDVCPKPITIMEAGLKKRKLRKDANTD